MNLQIFLKEKTFHWHLSVNSVVISKTFQKHFSKTFNQPVSSRVVFSKPAGSSLSPRQCCQSKHDQLIRISLNTTSSCCQSKHNWKLSPPALLLLPLLLQPTRSRHLQPTWPNHLHTWPHMTTPDHIWPHMTTYDHILMLKLNTRPHQLNHPNSPNFKITSSPRCGQS